MLLICAALPAELKVAKELRAKKGRQFLCTWMGNYQTIYTLTNYLAEHHEVDELLFVGVCGRVQTNESLVQVANVINATTQKEIVLPVHRTYAPLVTMLSSEVAIHTPEQMGNYQYVDMESRWVALVAEKSRLPCTILRIPIDEIWSVACTTFDRTRAIEEMKNVLYKSDISL